MTQWLHRKTVTDRSRRAELPPIAPVVPDCDAARIMTEMDAGAAVHDGVTSSAVSHGTPMVFVVDDDVSVRESLESLIRNEGWQPETFESAQEFLCRKRVLVPNRRVLDNYPQGISYLPGSACAADCRLEGLSRRGVLRFALMTGIALVAMGTNAIAAGQATSEIERFAASLLSLSRSASAPFAQRFAQFAAAVDDTFDVQSILRTSVGPSWDAMSPDEQGRLFQVFREYTIASFVANFDKPRNGFQVAQERDVGTRKIVDSTIGDTKLSFVLLQTSSRWRVVDVLLDGTISRVATQRSDFRSALSHGGGPALLEALQRKLSDLSGGTVA